MNEAAVEMGELKRFAPFLCKEFRVSVYEPKNSEHDDLTQSVASSPPPANSTAKR